MGGSNVAILKVIWYENFSDAQFNFCTPFWVFLDHRFEETGLISFILSPIPSLLQGQGVGTRQKLRGLHSMPLYQERAQGGAKTAFFSSNFTPVLFWFPDSWSGKLRRWALRPKGVDVPLFKQIHSFLCPLVSCSLKKKIITITESLRSLKLRV